MLPEILKHIEKVFVKFAVNEPIRNKLPLFKFNHVGNTLFISDPSAIRPYRTSPMKPYVGDEHIIHDWSLPEDQGTIRIDFHLTKEHKYLPERFFELCYPGETFIDGLLKDYCEEANCFMAGVPVTVDFTDEELELLDKAREKTGESREEFINTAIKKACADLAFFDKEPAKEPNFTDKIVEALGEGTTVIYREPTDEEAATLVIGLPGREVVTSKVDTALLAYSCDQDALAYAIQEIVSADGREQLEGVAYFRFIESSDPYKVEDIHDGWLHQIKYTFGLVPWTDADSVFEGEA